MVVISAPCGGDGEGEAGVDAAAVEEHGAGAALAVVAALFGAGEVEVLAQGVEQGGAGVERELVRFAVDLEGEVEHLRRAWPDRLRLGESDGGQAGGDAGAEDAGGLDEAAAGEAGVRRGAQRVASSSSRSAQGGLTHWGASGVGWWSDGWGGVSYSDRRAVQGKDAHRGEHPDAAV